MTAVKCIEVCRTFQQGETKVIGLDHVSVEIEAGDFVCLSAPSGGGKTTLLNAIGGLDTPDSGEIYISGNRIDNLNKSDLADMRLRNIGFVFQAYNLIPVLTARENIEFVMQVQGVPAAERRALALDILKEVGLEGWPTVDRPRCPVGNSSVSPWREPSYPDPRWCWRMNQPPTLIRIRRSS